MLLTRGLVILCDSITYLLPAVESYFQVTLRAIEQMLTQSISLKRLGL